MKYTNAAIAMETGMVRIHAYKRLMETPHFTAVTRRVMPVPIIAPVMVCVVLTGIPKASVKNNSMAPAVSAATPSKGVSLVILVPMVFTILHPPDKVPSPMAV